MKELMTYDDHVNGSFHHVWALPDEREELVFYPASSYAIDANTTFTVCSL